MADLGYFLRLARPMQNHEYPAGWSGGGSGRQTMTLNFGNMQQLAISVVGAIFAASLFISAAVGPAGQFI